MESLLSWLLQLTEKVFFFFVPFVVIDEYQSGVLLRFGKYKKVVLAGFHWRWPFSIDEFVMVDIATETITTEPQSLTTKDGKNIVVSAKVKCYVYKPDVYAIKVKDVTNAISDITMGKIKQAVMKASWEECRENEFDTKITQTVRTEADKWGVSIERVTTVNLQLTGSIRVIK
jgi:regulator of protease activity HflC (stomatin/prohibitin superfamily)